MRLSIWLLPDEEASSALQQDIAVSSILRGRAHFSPHLTLATGVFRDKIDAGLQAVSADFTSISLARDGVIVRPETFTQAFALKFAPSVQLKNLCARVSDVLGVQPDAEYVPHLSLTYGAIRNTKEFDAIAGRYNGPMNFNRLQAVIVPGRNLSQADVANWKYQQPLRLRTE